MAPYQYEPLDSPATQIRLLDLLPGRGTIKCRLKVVDLEKARNTYEPLSYCWRTTVRYLLRPKSKQQKCCRIWLDGADLVINSNLSEALRQLRLSGGVRTLWADAICINQNDNLEKSFQVSMMADIYRSGSRTVAWLGRGSLWSERSFRYLEKMADRRKNQSPADARAPEADSDYTAGEDPGLRSVWKSTADQTRERRFAWLRSLWDLQSISHLQHSLHLFIGKAYFKRAWVSCEGKPCLFPLL